MSQRVTCPHCENEIEVTATEGAVVACPRCRQPFKVPVIPTARPPVQTIEQTAKRWKLLQLIGGAGIVLGVLVALLGIVTEVRPLFVLALVIVTPASGIYLYGRMAAWWYHG